MNQEFQIGNFKLIQDETGYGIMRQLEKGIFETIATFLYPEDALSYFHTIVMGAIAYNQDLKSKEK